MQLSSLLPANDVTANFCEVEPVVKLFLPLLQAPLIKVKDQFLLWQGFCQIILMLLLGKGLTNFANRKFLYNKITAQYSYNSSAILCYCRTIVFYATSDKIRFTNYFGSSLSGRSVPNVYRLCLMYLAGLHVPKPCFFPSRFFVLQTHAIIRTFSGSFLALPEEVIFSTVLFEKESFLVCC